ncbi:MAG: cytochrome P450 [Armatimonadota bacterium]
MAQLPPGIHGFAAMGLMREARERPLEVFPRLHRQFGDVVRVGLGGPLLYYLLFHPDGAEQVLAHNHKGYRKGLVNAQFEVLDGNGLVTSEGSFWQRQRRLAQPAFHRQRIAALAGVIVEDAADLAEEWSERARSGAAVDVVPEMLRLTLRIAARTLFGVELGRDPGEIEWAVDVARDHITHRMYRPFYPRSLPTPRNRKFWRARRLLDDVVYGIIRERRAAPAEAAERHDVLTLFLQARDEETGEGMSDLELRDEVMTMLMAGHESTAVTLSWVWYLLAMHPHMQEKLRAEIDRALGGRRPTWDDLARIPYARMVVEETLRLYPTVWALSRQAIQDDEIGGYRIPAGGYATPCAWVIHRRPDLWPEPDRFQPERFDPERAPERHRFAYFPFGGGPRKCIGSQFALAEAQLVLITLLQRFEVSLPVGEPPLELDAQLSLRPKHGVRLRLREIRPTPTGTVARAARVS